MVATPTRPKAQLAAKPEIVWEKLPEDFVLPDDPVDNINQPALAAALTDSLSLAGYLSETAATTTNYGICAKVDGKTVVKAPDWSWIPEIVVPRAEIERSYTPVLEGAIPLVVMEFISETEGTEYSVKPTYPPGKWFYYERILKVPTYVIFHHRTGTIEFYQLSEKGTYELQPPDQDGLYWLAEANLFLGAWEGNHQNQSGWWLRWWDADKEMLLWSEDLSIRAKQRANQSKQRADQAFEEAQQVQRRAIAKLIALGLSIDQVADTLSLSVEDVQQQLEN